jgi:hypothetical protein
MKGKALRRALETIDAPRIDNDIPLITDSTELITPQLARDMLTRNKHNREVNWDNVENYAMMMRKGEWKLHAQGIVLDGDGNILTGQQRLWAVIYADASIYMRVSRGNPPDTAFVIDRGRPQSARDLATRVTERKHSPVESSIVKCACILRNIVNPSQDDISAVIIEKDQILSRLMEKSAGTKKTKAFLMILGAITELSNNETEAIALVNNAPILTELLEHELLPFTAERCWGRGISFGMAMGKAKDVVLRTS